MHNKQLFKRGKILAKVKVKYLAEMTQTIDWPDDEMDNFSYDNVVANLNPEDASVTDYNFDLKDVSVDGKSHEF